MHCGVGVMRVSTCLLEVTVQDAAMLPKTVQKSHFYSEIWKVQCAKCESKQKNMDCVQSILAHFFMARLKKAFSV